MCASKVDQARCLLRRNQPPLEMNKLSTPLWNQESYLQRRLRHWWIHLHQTQFLKGYVHFLRTKRLASIYISLVIRYFDFAIDWLFHIILIDISHFLMNLFSSINTLFFWYVYMYYIIFLVFVFSTIWNVAI